MTRPQLNPTIQRIAFLIATPVIITAAFYGMVGFGILVMALYNLIN